MYTAAVTAWDSHPIPFSPTMPETAWPTLCADIHFFTVYHIFSARAIDKTHKNFVQNKPIGINLSENREFLMYTPVIPKKAKKERRQNETVLPRALFLLVCSVIKFFYKASDSQQIVLTNGCICHNLKCMCFAVTRHLNPFERYYVIIQSFA